MDLAFWGVVIIGGLLVTVLASFIYLKNTIKKGFKHMAATLDDILAEIAGLKTVNDSIIELVVKIKGLLDAAIATGDMEKVQTAVDELEAEKARIAAAVVANTPNQ